MVITNKWTYLFVVIVPFCDAAYSLNDSDDAIESVLSPNAMYGQAWLNSSIMQQSIPDSTLCDYTFDSTPPPKRQRTMSAHTNSPNDISTRMQELESRLALATNKTSVELQLLQEEQARMKKQYDTDLVSMHNELNQLHASSKTASSSLENIHKELEFISSTIRTLISSPLALSDLHSQRAEVLQIVEPQIQHVQQQLQTLRNDFAQIYADIQINNDDIRSMRRSLALLPQPLEKKLTTLQEVAQTNNMTPDDLKADALQLCDSSCGTSSSSSSSSWTQEDDLPLLAEIKPITQATQVTITSMEGFARSWMRNLYTQLSGPLCSERGIERAQQFLNIIPDKTSPLAQRVLIGIANTYIKLGNVDMAKKIFADIDANNLGEQTYGAFKVPSAQISYEQLRKRLFP